MRILTICLGLFAALSLAHCSNSDSSDSSKNPDTQQNSQQQGAQGGGMQSGAQQQDPGGMQRGGGLQVTDEVKQVASEICDCMKPKMQNQNKASKGAGDCIRNNQKFNDMMKSKQGRRGQQKMMMTLNKSMKNQCPKVIQALQKEQAQQRQQAPRGRAPGGGAPGGGAPGGGAPGGGAPGGGAPGGGAPGGGAPDGGAPGGGQ